MSYEPIPKTPRNPNVPAVNWNIHIVDDKGDSYNIKFFGTVDQTKVKAEGMINKLKKAGLESTADLTLIAKGLHAFTYRHGHWVPTIDGLVMGFTPNMKRPVFIDGLEIH